MWRLQWSVYCMVAACNMQKRVRDSGERGRGDDKLQATISLSVKRLENYMRVSTNDSTLYMLCVAIRAGA